MASVCVCSDYFQVNEAGELCLVPGQQGLRDTIYFRQPGIHQFRKTDYPWLARIRVRCQAGGGGSAGANALDNECIARPGGSGGAYSESLLEVSALGAVETVVVGAGGTPGAANAAGGRGGDSTFGGLVVAPGGDGGSAAQVSGTTPDASTGTIGASVGSGQITTGGGPGGAAVRLSGNRGMSGAGGDSHLGWGGHSRAGFEEAGTDPRGYGGGAGGSLSYGAAVAGAAGGNGIVIIELYG